MPNLTLNGKQVEFEQGLTLIQVCEQAGVEIPRFCYHERLKIAGNCRMCLVEVKGAPPKPVASCAMQANDGMEVYTNSPMVKKAREGVMEFLLINHPLDCPICDQGGECDLQDQAMEYSTGQSRFEENKRAVKDKNLGPLIKTHMTRCIHCTRCIRFLEDVAGSPEMGATGRGEHMEVGTYIEKSIQSEMSGNIIDLCPVGALNNKPYAFTARSWELKKTYSIDVMDAVGSNIRIDTRGNQIMRIMPSLNEEINAEWISDKTRFVWDGLKLQRLNKPMLKRKGKLVRSNFEEVNKLICDKLKKTDPAKIGAIAGNLSDVESMFLLKRLFNRLGSNNIDCRQDLAAFDASQRISYIMGTKIDQLEEADFCLLINTNTRLEAPIINTRLRAAYLENKMETISISEIWDANFPVDFVGSDVSLLQDILSGKTSIASKIQEAKRPLIIIGQDALTRPDGKSILSLCYDIARKYDVIKPNWFGFNILQKHASRVGGLDVGFFPDDGGKNTSEILHSAKSGGLELLFLLGADEVDLQGIPSNCLVVYQGHHGDKSAPFADVILPASAYTEKVAFYTNTEGRVQSTRKSVANLGEAKEDWVIINDIAKLCEVGHFASLAEIRREIARIHPAYQVANIASRQVFDVNTHDLPAKLFEGKDIGKIDKTKNFSFCSEKFYLSNSVCRSSKTMAQCDKHQEQKQQ